jgi:adenosylcobyric acid synthase
MLGTRIDDDVESRAGRVEGIGLLPVRTAFEAAKTLRRPVGVALAYGGAPAAGYEIHHGVVDVDGGEPLIGLADGSTDGCRVGAVAGTLWHGLLENDELRRALLVEVAAAAGKAWLPGTEPYAAVRERRLDALGDLVADHLDTDAIWRLIDDGRPAGLPAVPPAGPPAVPPAGLPAVPPAALPAVPPAGPPRLG